MNAQNKFTRGLVIEIHPKTSHVTQARFTIWDGETQIGSAFTAADAARFAAAPDLLAALKLCVEGFRDAGEKDGGTIHQKANAAYEKARAILAKIEGGAE